MKYGRVTMAALLGILTLGGCTTYEDGLAERDRQLNEQQREAESLRKRLEDERRTQDLVQRELENRKNEAARFEAERNAAVSSRDGLEEELRLLRSSAPVAQDPAGPALDIDPSDGIEVETRANGEIVLRLNDRVTFSSGSADLTRQGQELVREVADVISRYPEFAVSIEGHTDDTPLKRTAARWKNNLYLSIARADRVRDFLEKVGKIPEERMRVVGYGSTRPLVAETTKEARARNRRVEIVLYHSAD